MRILAALVLFVIIGCGPSKRTRYLHESAITMVGPLPETAGKKSDTAELVKLGERLYFDTILSANDSVSCNSCHRVDNLGAGVDGGRVSAGVGGKEGNRNSPTVLNAALHTAQFWDGRAKDLEAQAGGPILNPIEMGMPNERFVEQKLAKHNEYPALFRKAFPGEPAAIRYNQITRAIAAYERTLVTSDRFDDFMRGNINALTGRELKGFALFMEIGCISCHNGKLLGGNTFRKVGGVIPYDNLTDLGRYSITKSDADKYVFKVPSLRNIELTAPYFHDGSRPTLESAILTMAQIQLGKNLNRLEVAYLADFLRTLTDKKRGGR